jgi:hypothetical protein
MEPRSDFEIIKEIVTREPLKSAAGWKSPITPNIEETDEGKIIEVSDGYVGFVAELTFDKDGKLESIAAWE